MPALKGRQFEFHVSAEAAANFNEVHGLNDASMSHSADNLDVTEFGDVYVRRIQGLKDGSYSLGGHYDPTDTTGQGLIRTTWLSDSDPALYARFLHSPNATAGANQGFQQKVVVSSFEISASADGTQELSIELEGDGAITAVDAAP
jgi:predicted secreted protein